MLAARLLKRSTGGSALGKGVDPGIIPADKEKWERVHKISDCIVVDGVCSEGKMDGVQHPANTG